MLEKLKQKAAFEQMLILNYPDVQWNFKWDGKEGVYLSRDISWMFYCYRAGQLDAATSPATPTATASQEPTPTSDQAGAQEPS
jgi:hypothetical protein